MRVLICYSFGLVFLLIISVAWRQCKSSIPKINVMFSSIYLAFLAAYPPIETWSYWLAEVEMESADPGFARTFDSDNKAADVSILAK